MLKWSPFFVAGATLGTVIDKAVGPDKTGDVHPALIKVGGAMYTVVAVIVLAGTFIPKGSLAFNPDLIGGDAEEDVGPSAGSGPIKIISDGAISDGPTTAPNQSSARDRELFDNIVG